MNWKTYLILLCVAGAAIYFFSCKKKKSCLVKKDYIAIGTSPDYPPYSFKDPKTNEIVGFDVDVAVEVAKKMKMKYIVKDMPFNSLLFGLLADDVDIIAAGLTPTEVRSQMVVFSHEYLEEDPLVALSQKRTTITSIDDLTKMSVAVNIGYTADLFLSTNTDINLVKLDSPPEAIMALQSNSVDVFVCAKSSLKNMQDKLKEFNLFTIPDTGDSYALAMSKHKLHFVEKVNNALQSMKKDGTLKMLQKKWGLSD